MRAILDSLALMAETTLDDAYPESVWHDILTRVGGHTALQRLLSQWAQRSDKPLVLLIDEIDSLVGDTLISVLRQLRAGYPMRPAAFPASVVLCGLRDVRDYRIESEESGESVTGGSAFNIKAESLRLGDFGKDEIRTLLGQHTADTGQSFTEAAIAAIWRETRGQPWLVNALARQACFKDEAGRNRSRPIDEDAVMEAREKLVLSRQTHLHQLAERLKEARVRRVVEPILSGETDLESKQDDVEYARDLGLVSHNGPREIANPIYREVIPRELMYAREDSIVQRTEWYVGKDGGLDVE